MSNLSKIIVTIGILIGYFFIFGLIVGIRDRSGHKTPGIIGLILTFGLIAALRAVWKKNNNQNKKDEDEDEDRYKLDKSL